MLLKHPKRIVLRELMPLFGLILTSMLLAINPLYAAVPLGAYACVLVVSGLLNIRKGISHVSGVPFALLILHVGFTFGLVDGLVRKGRASRDR